MSDVKKYTFWIYKEYSRTPAVAENTEVNTEVPEPKLVCKIYLTENQNKECKATLEVVDEDNLPVDFPIVGRTSEQLVWYLKDRAIPENRNRLEELLAPYGIAVDDWIGRLGLTKGRACDDDYCIIIEKE